jgi:hypothetical protein
MAMVKDFANALRRNRWDWTRIDKDIADRFTPEQRARMWNAADEESVSRQLGEPEHMREHQGLATLEPAERAAVDEQQARAQNAWTRARDLGMVEGEGLPAYTPRMVINVASAGAKEKALPLNSIGSNLRTKTSNLLKRKYLEAQDTEAAAKAKYGDEAMLARDIRVLPLATSHLEDAIAGRTLINNIKDYGARTGADTVVEGAIPAGTDAKWFTLDHPVVPDMATEVSGGRRHGAGRQGRRGQHGFRAGADLRSRRFRGAAARGAAAQIRPALRRHDVAQGQDHEPDHELADDPQRGRVGPGAATMPGKVATFKVYFEGNRAKNNVAVMGEAIDNGLVPIGHRFFNQDISGIMEAPDLTPGRSWTAKCSARCPACSTRRRERRSSARSIRPATSGTTRCCGIASQTCRWASM